MRLLKKLLIKLATLVVMVGLMSVGLRYARPYIMKAAGVPEMPGVTSADGVAGANFSSEESDLMSTVFKSAMRFLSGSASRNELAGELSDKLYAGRAGSAEMSELGIELVKPDGSPTDPGAGGATPETGAPGAATAGANTTSSPSGAKALAKPGVVAGQSSAKQPAKPGQPPAVPAVNDALLSQYWAKAKRYSIELTLIPIVLVGMVVVQRVRRRRSPEDAFMLPDLSLQASKDTEPYTMKHQVHSLSAEDFELLVALIYQRQGYRVTMPAGLSGGRGGDFTLARKAERLLVQCKRLNADHKVPVERVRELHDAITAAGVTRGLFVASCSFSWDARNFAKAKGITLINARTLDELLTAVREKPDENLLAVPEWAPKLMAKVKLTPSLCPACEAPMDQLSVSNGSVWVCSQRPDCRGRRCARKYQRQSLPASANAEASADGVSA